MMKTIASLLFAILLLQCAMPCCAKNIRKLKKPILVASKSESSLYDMQKTDDYDSLYFDYELVMSELGNITCEIRGNERSHKEPCGYGVASVEKFVFYRKGFTESDTLYAWHVPLRYGEENEIVLNNEGTTLKIFGRKYGKNVVISTPDNKFRIEKPITDGMTEVQIPEGVEFLNIDIECDEQKHYTFKYPVR